MEGNLALAVETEQRRLDPARVAAGVAGLLQDPTRGTYFVAERQGTFAGQLLVTYEWSDWRNGNFWWIQSVYVLKDCRRQGVFRALFAHVHHLAKARTDVCGIRLYMEAQNDSARRTYDNLGFKATPYEMFEMDFVLTHHD